MGSGSWKTSDFVSYSTSAGKKVDARGVVDVSGLTTRDVFKAASIDMDTMNPRGQVRECCETEEHPNTVPVILALDVTGSMGPAALEVASKLHQIVSSVVNEVKDAEFLIMGLGDLDCDSYPLQASQFESDVRTAKNLDSIFFEGGGGDNLWESYTAAWYFGLHNTRLDCWKRGRRGVIITMGDEQINPQLDHRWLNATLGCSEQADVGTAELYTDVKNKYDVYHIHVNHNVPSERRAASALSTFGAVIGEGHVKVSTINQLSDVIHDIVVESAFSGVDGTPVVDFAVPVEKEAHAEAGSSGDITW